MNYFSSNAAHIYHSANKSYESKLIQDRQLALFRQQDNSNAVSSSIISSSEDDDEMYEDALNVYLLAEKRNKKSNFGTQKAQLYAHLGKADLMIEQKVPQDYANTVHHRRDLDSLG